MYGENTARKRKTRIKIPRERRLEIMDTIETYENLCREFRKMAEEKGFAFPAQIWLRHVKSGVLFKKG